MNATKSASKSQKTATISAEPGKGGTPFDQILSAEQQEKIRVQTEIDAMRKVEEETRQSCAKKESDTEVELKEKAKAELMVFKDEELAPILKAAESDAAKECEKLEELYKKNAEALAKETAKKLITSDSSPAA